jgi:hypothetical protein
MTVPIIFVPGIMGSRLLFPGGSNWDPDSSFGILEWATRDAGEKRRDLDVVFRPSARTFNTFSNDPLVDATLQLANNETLKNIAAAAHVTTSAFYAARGWAGVSWRFYGEALILLETTLNVGTPLLTAVPNPVYAFAYDWRQPNRANGLKLAAFVDQVLTRESATKIALVTHSMGGLVARAASLVPTVLAKVNGVVHSAQPSIGAIAAYRRYQTGCMSAFDGKGVVERLLQVIMGKTNEEYAAITSGIPSSVELTPNRQFGQFSNMTWLVTTPPTDQTQIYEAYKGPMPPGVVPPALRGPGRFGMQGGFIAAALLARVDGAAQFHSALGNNGFPRTYVLYGDGLTTDQIVSFTAAGIKVSQSGIGDGTVPQSSGSCPGLKAAGLVADSTLLHGVDHSQMFHDPTHNAQLLTYIRKLI